LHSQWVLYYGFVWARWALNSQKRRFLARAGAGSSRFAAAPNVRQHRAGAHFISSNFFVSFSFFLPTIEACYLNMLSMSFAGAAHSSPQ
jgi:hypothetical protein